MQRTATMLLGLLVVLLSCSIQPSESLRILALFPMNSKSHNAMCERLARGLAARGHQVDIYSHYPPKKPIANYNHHSLEGTLPDITNNVTFSTTLKFQAQNAQETIAIVGDPSCTLLELPIFQQLLKNPPKNPAYDLVIVEAFIADCYLAWGRHLDVPMVGVMTTPMMDWYNEALGNPFNTAVTPAMGVTGHAPKSFWQRLKNTVMSAVIQGMFFRAIAHQSEYVEKFFGPGYPDVHELRRDLDLLIVNTHFSLEGIRPYTPAIIPVAGIHINDEDQTNIPSDMQKWLDDSKHGCVYFTFGSMVKIESFPKPVIDAFYATFKNIAPVRVLLKIADPKDLPAKLPANVMAKSWFPQLQVLKHKNTKAFITHGGLMSSQEAIHCGVPMVGIPLFGDQPINVQTNVRKGIATSVELDGIDEQKLTAAIKDVLENPSYKQKIEKLSRAFVDRPMKPLETAIYWVEYVARHGKKCLRSPLVDMPWWQANLLDVYAFLISVLLAIYYIAKFAFQSVYSACCSNKKENTPSKTESKKKR